MRDARELIESIGIPMNRTRQPNVYTPGLASVLGSLYIEKLCKLKCKPMTHMVHDLRLAVAATVPLSSMS